jgi:tetratricopeptide (TPR) repeat protein
MEARTVKSWALASIVTLIAGIAGSAAAQSRDLDYGPAPSWVSPPPAATSSAPPSGASARIVFTDRQDRVSADGEEVYSASRLRILTPDGLSLGNMTAAWNPSTDHLTVHELHIVRDGKVIDVLANSKFRVIEREENLDQATLDGNLTATLQIPDLQVGDEIDFAATIRTSGGLFAGRESGNFQLPVAGLPGAYRVRLLWPDGVPMRWTSTPDLGKLTVEDHAGQQELQYELRDPTSIVVADGAPGRFNIRRNLEYSRFANWNDLARLFAPIFDQAGKLAPDSPVRLEVAKIANSTKDPVARIEAALQLVEDRVRYVYVGLNGGNYMPASADTTWSRRFGDCKAKAVLLAAILRELGVASEVVLVNSKGGDGSNERLPTPALFDHVVVRATVGTKRYWLDATRLGDRHLKALPGPVFRWDLPLTPSGDLEAAAISVPALPLASTVIDIDAGAGFDRPAKVKVEQVFRDERANSLRQILSNMSASDAQQGLRQYWGQAYDTLQAERMGWRFDYLQNAVILTASGDMKLDWQGDAKTGHSLTVLGAGFTPPNELRRPKEQDQTAPWTTTFPLYSRWTTIIRLPHEAGKWRWDYSDAPVHITLGGVAYWREADLKDGVLRSTMGKRADLPEITPDQAKALNDGLPGFDNAMSMVFETRSPAEHSLTRPSSVKSQSDYASLRRMQTAALIKAGQAEEALDTINEVIARDPEEAANLRTRAAVFAALGKTEEGLDDLDEAWRINPLDPASVGARADVIGKVSRTEEIGAPYDPWQAPAALAATSQEPAAVGRLRN